MFSIKDTNLESRLTADLNEDNKSINDLYEEKHLCYHFMHNDAMEIVKNTTDCYNNTPVTITADDLKSITIECGDVKDVYELYEM